MLSWRPWRRRLSSSRNAILLCCAVFLFVIFYAAYIIPTPTMSKEISTEPVNPKKDSDNDTLKNQTIRTLKKVVKQDSIKADPRSIDKLKTDAIPIKTQVIERDKLQAVDADKKDDSEDLAHNGELPEEPDQNNESEEDEVESDISNLNDIPAHLPHIPPNNNIAEKVQEVVRNKFQVARDAIDKQAAPVIEQSEPEKPLKPVVVEQDYVVQLPKAPVADTDKSSVIKNAEMSPMKKLEAEVTRSYSYKNPYKVVWITHIRASYGSGDMKGFSSAGFAREAVDFILPLCQLMPSSFGWQEEGKGNLLWQEDSVWKEMDTQEQDIMMRCFKRGEGLLQHNDTRIGISMIQFAPFDYTKIRKNYEELNKFDYIMGRAMFETNSLPKDWEHHMNRNLDEVWVPSHFEKEVFETNGVLKKVSVIGEGFDTNRLIPSIAVNKRDVIYPSCNKDDFIFVAVSKFEDRKGYDHLLEAYSKEFRPEDKVCLALRASGLQSDIQFANDKVLRHCKVARLTDEDYPNMYKSANAFVLATHGEGWGRTIMEAMAMGLPTLVPLWGGLTEYANKDIIIPIVVPGLERPPRVWPLFGNYNKHHWAKVDVPEIQKAMRWTYENQAAAKEIGQRAQDNMFENYTREKIAQTAMRRFEEIADMIAAKKYAL